MKYIILFLLIIPSLSSKPQDVYGTVYFNTGSFEPVPTELIKLPEIVNAFVKGNFSSIKVIAYADTTSNWAFNLTLSQKRANRIKKLLIQNGVHEEQMQVFHKGEVATGNDLKNDRRADIYFLKNTLSLKEIFEALDVESQYYTINPLTENEFRCTKGTILQIPKDCFVDEMGNIITTSINLEVKEYYNLGDYLKKGLFTTSIRKGSEKSELLQSGGVININANNNGKKIYFNSGMKMGIGFNSPADQSMMAFMGKPTEKGVSWFEDLVSKSPGRGVKGTEIWTKDSVLLHITDERGRKLPLDTVLNGAEIKTYRFIDRLLPSVFVNDFGFINCDKFWNDPTAVEMQMTFELSHFSDEEETSVYMIFQKTMSILPAYKTIDAKGKTLFQSPRMKMPYGTKAHVIILYKKENEFYLGAEQFDLKGDKQMSVEFYKASLKDVTELLAQYGMQ